MGDEAYSSRGHRALLRARGIRAVIAEPADQQANRKRRGPSGGRPPPNLDVEKDKKHHVGENGFNDIKQRRALATRYDKLALTYRAGVLLKAVIIWPTTLGDTP